MNKKYDYLISNLENIVENWYDKEELHKFILAPYDGLCDNIRDLECGVPKDCIKDWMYFNGDIMYPVGGVDEYKTGNNEAYSLFNNPKRLHLAVHMLQWLRQCNI